MVRSALVALIVSCVFPALCPAENIVGSSLEWLTCSSEVVVVGRIEKIVTTRGPGDVFYDDCTVAIQEVIRGKVAGDRLVFCLRTLSADAQVKGWMKSQEPLLLFLLKSTDHGPEKHLDGMLVPTSHQIPLSVIDLAAPGKYVLDTRFKLLTDRKAILDVCRKTAERLVEYLKRNPGARVEATRLEVPLDSEAWRSLYGGSACHLKAPVFAAQGQR